jgi:hypothetical protein
MLLTAILRAPLKFLLFQKTLIFVGQKTFFASERMEPGRSKRSIFQRLQPGSCHWPAKQALASLKWSMAFIFNIIFHPGMIVSTASLLIGMVSNTAP